MPIMIFSVENIFPAKRLLIIPVIPEKICEPFPPARLTTVTAFSTVFYARFPKIAQNIVTQASVKLTIVPHGRKELQRPFRFFLLLCQGLTDSQVFTAVKQSTPGIRSVSPRTYRKPQSASSPVAR